MAKLREEAYEKLTSDYPSEENNRKDIESDFQLKQNA